MEINLKGDISLNSFTEQLASDQPAPGGGGASALTGAIGAALCSMTCNLTKNKKKFAEYGEEYESLLGMLDRITKELISLIEEDAKGFLPLIEAYSLPAGTEEEAAKKAAIMEKEYVNACRVPLAIMDNCCRAVNMCARITEICAKSVKSDAAAAAILLEAAIKAASLNVFINTGYMKDREKAEALNAEASEMSDEFCQLAASLYEAITFELKEQGK